MGRVRMLLPFARFHFKNDIITEEHLLCAKNDNFFFAAMMKVFFLLCT